MLSRSCSETSVTGCFLPRRRGALWTFSGRVRNGEPPKVPLDWLSESTATRPPPPYTALTIRSPYTTTADSEKGPVLIIVNQAARPYRADGICTKRGDHGGLRRPRWECRGEMRFRLGVSIRGPALSPRASQPLQGLRSQNQSALVYSERNARIFSWSPSGFVHGHRPELSYSYPVFSRYPPGDIAVVW
ncbi:hypothetical protein OH77DRAFT_1122887 [Trametes cingulata]|nr:hypothetical protein OH77DRAFT_1122887 [Trametes cingulata]